MPYDFTPPENWTWNDGFENICPPDSQLLNAPFRPYFVWPYLTSDINNCWGYAECHFAAAAESRKQQWAAFVMVMGVLPITLFVDVHWPRKNLVYMRRRPSWLLEVVIRALGLDLCEGGSEASQKNRQTQLGKWAQRARKSKHSGRPWMLFIVSVFALLGTYAALALTEIYSKRSSIGCTYPLFVVTWYIIAVIPASIHTATRRYFLPARAGAAEVTDASAMIDSHKGAAVSEEEHENTRDWWGIQMAWSIYYIAGTLVYSSIMVVMVPELVVWVFASCLAVFAGKMCAFLLCQLVDDGSSDGASWTRLQSM